MRKLFRGAQSISYLYGLAFLIVSLLSQNLWAGNGAFLPGYLAISEGMAGAGVALPQDVSVLLSNPAGMADLGRMVNFNFTLGSVDGVMDTSTVALPFGNPAAVNVKNVDDIIFLPSGGILWSLNDRWSAGMGLFSVAGFGADFPVSRSAIGAASAVPFDTHTNYGLLKVLLAGSYKIFDKLAVGLSFHLNRAVVETDSVTAAGTETTGRGRQDSSFGAGFGVGFLYEPLKWLAMGLNYTSEQFFQSPERYTDITTKGVNIPQQLSFGFTFTPVQKLKLATDFLWINWSGVSGPIGQSVATGGFGWRDQYVGKIGAQYHIWEPLILRAGYNYGRTVVGPGAAFANAIVGAGGRHHLAVGFGLRFFKNVDLDFSYLRTFKAGVTDPVGSATAGASISNAANEGSMEIGVHF